MTEREFLERMIALTGKLCDIYDTDPFDQDARKVILDEVRETGIQFNHSRRISTWIIKFVYIAAILFVIYLVYCGLSEL